MAITEIIEGQEYLLKKIHTDMPLTIQQHANYDYVTLTGDVKSGRPVVFEQHPERPGEYYIRMLNPHWKDYCYFTSSSKGWIYLDTLERAGRFGFKLNSFGHINTWHYEGHENHLNFLLIESGGTEWLSTDGYKRKLLEDEPNTRLGERVETYRDEFQVVKA